MTQIENKPMNVDRDPQTYAIIGAVMEVHRIMQKGFLEAVYQEALAIEFELRDIPFQREMFLPVKYKNRLLGTLYKADFVCFDRVVIELKAIAALHASHEAQTIHYLRATGHHLGLLINFGADSLEYRRFIQSA